MGISVATDIFQEKMSNLFHDLEYARTYLDDLITLTKGNFQDHINKLRNILTRMREAGLKINAEKSKFCATELEYLGYWITRDGIKPLEDKVKAILELDPPSTLRELRHVLGLFQYYRNIYQRRSHILAPLTDLVGECSPKKGKKSSKFVWQPKHQKSFEDYKKLVAREIMLAFPDFTKEFHIYTDSSSRQLGSAITQDGLPLALYSKKLTKCQMNYSITDLELLSIVMTLKQFRNILLGRKIKVYSDHKNLEAELANMSSQRGIHWRMLIEEYGIEIVYLPGKKNIVADALSRLSFSPSKSTEQLFCLSSADEAMFPLDTKLIAEHQEIDDELKSRMKDNSKNLYTKKYVHDNYVILENSLIYVPKPLRERALNWYHHYLVHPGENRMLNSIKRAITWPGIRQDVHKKCKYCKICQLSKRLRRSYGELAPKEAEYIPWHTVCVDCIGPWTIKQRKSGKIIKLNFSCLTMIDPASSWPEIAVLPGGDIDSALMSKLFNIHWLTRYPRPQRVQFDNGSEFKLHFKALCKEYGIKGRPTSSKNPQANSIVERLNGKINSMVRALNLDAQNLDLNDPFSEIVANCTWALRASYHSTLQASPGQTVFGRDMLFDLTFNTKWDNIQENKQQKINYRNIRENLRRIPFDYQIGDKVVIHKDHKALIRKAVYVNDGPFVITQVFTNGTVRIQKGRVNERINIRRLSPFFSED